MTRGMGRVGSMGCPAGRGPDRSSPRLWKGLEEGPGRGDTALSADRCGEARTAPENHASYVHGSGW